MRKYLLAFTLAFIPLFAFAQASPPPLPPQAGQSGKYLTTNGSKLSWGVVSGGTGTPGGTPGQVQINNAGAFGGITIGGDATLNSITGALTITKTSGVSFATSATTDATNASNISSGSLSYLRLGAMTSAQFSGVLSDPTSLGALIGNVATATNAATLTTPRAIYGNNFDGSAALSQIIASTYGGTGNGFAKFSGPTTAEKTFTLPDASATLLYSGGALGTPSSGVATNLTGTAAALNIGGNAATATSATNLTGASTGVSLALSSTISASNLPAGAIVGTTDTQTISAKRITKRVTSLSSSSTSPTFTISGDTTDVVNISATGSTGTITFAAPSPSTPNDVDQIEIRITCTNAQTYSWNAVFAASSSLALPTAATGSGKTDKILFEYNTAASKWQLQATNFGF